MSDQMNHEELLQKSLDILKSIAYRVASGESMTIGPDWGYGSGTLMTNEGHTHFGLDIGDDEKAQLASFVDGLHGLLVRGQGLSFVKDEVHE